MSRHTLPTIGLILSLAASARAQTFSCDGLNNVPEYQEFLARKQAGIYDPTQLPNPSPFPAYNVKLAFHRVGLSASTTANAFFDAAHIDRMVNVANAEFGVGSSIQFSYVPSETTYDVDASLSQIRFTPDLWSVINLYDTPDAIDVYIVDRIRLEDVPGAGGFVVLRGFGTYTLCTLGQGVVIMRNSTPDGASYGFPSNGVPAISNDGVWAHELGHYFDLLHTYADVDGSPQYVDCPTGSTCNTLGDFVCDTPAEPFPGTPGASWFPSTQGCFWIGPVQSPPGSPCAGQFFHPAPRNHMNAHPDLLCRSEFTNGQKERMHATLVNLRPELLAPCLADEDMLACVPPQAGQQAGYSASAAPIAGTNKVVAVLGAPTHDGGEGRVLVLEDNVGGTFGDAATLDPVFKVALTAQVERPGDYFGASVAFDGSTLLVGAPSVSNNPPVPCRTYVYRRQSNQYVLEATLFPPVGADINTDFGRSVDVYGEWAVVGAPTSPPDPFTGRQGAAYLFKRDAATSTWSLVTTLQASDPTVSAGFGSSVTVSGEHVVVGASNAMAGGVRAGAAYSFLYSSATGTWSGPTKLPQMHAAHGNEFGASVSAWGQTLLVGAPGTGRSSTPPHMQPGSPPPPPEFPGCGAAHLYEYRNGAWRYAKRLLSPTMESGLQFGNSVALNGTHALIGAPGLDSSGLTNPGGVLEFGRTISGWVLRRTTVPDTAGAFESFGSAVASTGLGWLGTVPSKNQGGSAPNSGGAYAKPLEPEASGLALTASNSTISIAAGGTHTMTIDLGPAFAGRPYGVAGTTGGTTPGQDFVALTVPPGPGVVPHAEFHSVLNPSPYYDQTSQPNVGSPRLSNNHGVLDTLGRAVVTFQWPANFNPGMAGTTYVHTAVLKDDLHYESAPVSVTLVP
jgi:hypothetical protein